MFLFFVQKVFHLSFIFTALVFYHNSRFVNKKLLVFKTRQSTSYNLYFHLIKKDKFITSNKKFIKNIVCQNCDMKELIDFFV